jgi:hypothetical protein
MDRLAGISGSITLVARTIIAGRDSYGARCKPSPRAAGDVQPQSNRKWLAFNPETTFQALLMTRLEIG